MVPGPEQSSSFPIFTLILHELTITITILCFPFNASQLELVHFSIKIFTGQIYSGSNQRQSFGCCTVAVELSNSNVETTCLNANLKVPKFWFSWRYQYFCLRSRPGSPNVVCPSVSGHVENSDRVTVWLSDQVTKWPSDRVTEWLSDSVT